MANLLLTGATGFVGRNFLLSALRSKRYEKIYLPVRSTAKLRSHFQGDGFSEIPENVIPIESGAHDWKLPSHLDVQDVIHSAGVLFGRSERDYHKVNVEGTLLLLEHLPPAANVIILSSQAAAGPCPSGTAARTEATPDTPITWYGKSKLLMEQEVRKRFSDRKLIFLRPSMVLGPRDQATLPLFKMAKLPIHIKPGFGAKYYSFVSVSDLVSALEQAFAKPHSWVPGQVYFIASETVIQDRELITTAGLVAGSRGIMFRIPLPALKVVSEIIERVPYLRDKVPNLTRDRAQEIWPERWVISPHAFYEAFGWKAKQDLTSALAETYDWYVRSGQLSASRALRSALPV